MKVLSIIFISLISIFSYSQDKEWVKTEGEIIEITFHRGKRIRESAIVKFQLEDGTEQLGSVELFRIPFIGSMKSVGDVITINFNKNNPVILETVFGKFASSYGMYVLIFLGIIFSIKPFLNRQKT